MVNREMKYNGKVVATVKTVERVGINVGVTFTNGYSIVVPPSMLAPEVAAML